MIDSPYVVKPGTKLKIAGYPTNDTGKFKNRDDAALETAAHLRRLDELQEVMYAEGKHALLIVFQAMDAGGKDGAIEYVFSGINPQGCMVTSFKVPTPLEKAHDFLWRIHGACPPKGLIGIFNRSHYESVLVERVGQITAEKVWRKRYEHINAMEQMLTDEGTTIVKFFLHISKDEQKERLQARLDDPHKNWKFNPGDLEMRKQWDAYQQAYEDALQHCSTEAAPWYVVPADRKWFRNWVVSDVLVRTLEKLDMKFPKPLENLGQYVIE